MLISRCALSSFTSPQSLTLDTSKNHATQHKKAQVDLAFLRVCCFSPILSPLLVRYFLLLLDMPPSPQNPMTIPANHSFFSVPSLPFLFFSFAILDPRTSQSRLSAHVCASPSPPNHHPALSFKFTRRRTPNRASPRPLFAGLLFLFLSFSAPSCSLIPAFSFFSCAIYNFTQLTKP